MTNLPIYLDIINNGPCLFKIYAGSFSARLRHVFRIPGLGENVIYGRISTNVKYSKYFNINKCTNKSWLN